MVLIFSNRHKGIESRSCQVRCIIERVRSRECVPYFAFFFLETCPQGFDLSCEQAKQSHRCGAIPSLMTAKASWVINVCSYKVGIEGTIYGPIGCTRKFAYRALICSTVSYVFSTSAQNAALEREPCNMRQTTIPLIAVLPCVR